MASIGLASDLKRVSTKRIVQCRLQMDEKRLAKKAQTSRWKLSKFKPMLNNAKEAVLRCVETGMAQGLAHESYLHALSCGTQDKKEGVASFLEKRAAKFTGK